MSAGLMSALGYCPEDDDDDTSHIAGLSLHAILTLSRSALWLALLYPTHSHFHWIYEGDLSVLQYDVKQDHVGTIYAFGHLRNILLERPWCSSVNMVLAEDVACLGLNDLVLSSCSGLSTMKYSCQLTSHGQRAEATALYR